MEDKLGIKVSISDRIYPLRVNREEEENVRKAAKLINDKLLEYKERGVADTTDALSLIAFNIARQFLNSDTSDAYKLLNSEVRQINSDLEEYLKKQR